MGSENADTVKAALELLNRGEIDELFDRFATEDVVWDHSRTIAPDQQGVYRGRDSAKRFARQLFVEPWEEFEFVADEYIEVDDDRLVIASHTRNVGRGGIEVAAHGAVLFEFSDDGKVAAMRLFQVKGEALDAATTGQ